MPVLPVSQAGPASPRPAAPAFIAAPPPGNPWEAGALALAQATAKEFGMALRRKLTAAIEAGGPVSAVSVCAGEAPALAESLRTRTGVAVGRASKKLRNAKSVTPPWVAAWLEQHASAKAAEAKGVQRIDAEGGGRKARFLVPIAIEAPCLLCHGPVEAMAAPLREALSQRYPGDGATGYALGELRGALWAEAEVRGPTAPR